MLIPPRLCSDAELMRNVWERYDAEEGGSKVFTSLTTALKRLVTEKPALLGVCTQMFGVGVPTNSSSNSDLAGYGLDVGGVAGMVATAASATVSAGLSMIGSEAGLSLHGSSMKLQWFAALLFVSLHRSSHINNVTASTSLTRQTLRSSRSPMSISSVCNVS